MLQLLEPFKLRWVQYHCGEEWSIWLGCGLIQKCICLYSERPYITFKYCITFK